jgi:predicted nicotinamide N-methyase
MNELDLTLAGREIRLAAPEGMSDDPEGRIYFWWGLTGSAILLAEHITGLGDLARKRVVELGCGLGLPGLAAGLGGAEVTFTDIKKDALDFARRNCVANGLSVDRTAFELLDWESPSLEDRYDLVVGAEIVYDYFMHDSLLGLLSGLLAPGGTILLADRKRLVVDRFMGRLHGEGFEISRHDRKIPLPGEETQTVSLYIGSAVY